MRRFTLGYVAILFLASVAFAQEETETRVYVVPSSKFSKTKKYTKEEIQKLYSDYVNSYEGKAFWGMAAKDKAAMASGAVIRPRSPVNLPTNDRAAFCYRCGLGRTDLVKKADCESADFAWKVSSLSELATCN